MILPAPDWHPLFADDGVPFREKMLAYIEDEFLDLLATRPDLLAELEQLTRDPSNRSWATDDSAFCHHRPEAA